MHVTAFVCACETIGSGEHPLENVTWTQKICKIPQSNPALNNILRLENQWLCSCSNNALKVHTCIPRNFIIPSITVCSSHKTDHTSDWWAIHCNFHSIWHNLKFTYCCLVSAARRTPKYVKVLFHLLSCVAVNCGLSL